MKKILLIDSSYPINTRNQKIIDSLLIEEPTVAIHVIAWDRLEKNPNNLKNYHIFTKYAEYGNVYDKLKYLYKFKKFIKDTIEVVNPSIIIASHWSTLILVPKLKNDQKLVYENLDVPTGSIWIRWILALLEKKALKNVSLIIHASRFFTKLYSHSIPQIVLENKPTFKITEHKVLSNLSKIRISFIGTVRYSDILFNLIDAVKNDNRFELKIHGTGPDLIKCQKYSEGISNVIFTGVYDYKSIVDLYKDSDLIWAAYPNKDFNVKYAISNKFHEAVCLETPCVFSDKTALGNYVKEVGVGLVVNPYDIVSIKELLNNVYTKNINLDCIIKNMRKINLQGSGWQQDFKQFALWVKSNK